MIAHRAQATIKEDGTVTLHDLPFSAGQSVEIIVLPARQQATPENPYSLRGLPVSLTQPFAPVAQAEWDAAA